MWIKQDVVLDKDSLQYEIKTTTDRWGLVDTAWSSWLRRPQYDLCTLFVGALFTGKSTGGGVRSWLDEIVSLGAGERSRRREPRHHSLDISVVEN